MVAFTIRQLNEDLKQVAKTELNEVESRIPEDIIAFRAWLEKQPHLKTRTDDQYLLSFLRGCKHSLEKAKSKIDYFYTIRTMIPDLFGNHNIDDKTLAFCRTGTYVHLPKPLGPGGPSLRLTNYTNFDAKQFHLNDLFRYQCLMMEYQFRENDNFVVGGYLEIIDMSGFNFKIMTQFDPMTLRKLGVFADKAAPIRMKGVHFINCPKEAQTLMTLGRSLMSEKIQKRFLVHKTLDDLYEHIPREYLPVEYGGTNGSIPEISAVTEKRLIELKDYFIEDQQYGVNEKLRLGNKIEMDSLFGIQGSFRKLDID